MRKKLKNSSWVGCAETESVRENPVKFKKRKPKIRKVKKHNDNFIKVPIQNNEALVFYFESNTGKLYTNGTCRCGTGEQTGRG